MIPIERLSRFLSFLLRHHAEDSSLNFDDRGFVSLKELMERVQDRFPEAGEEEILAVIEGPDKKRFELKDGKVRAIYGHSFPVNFENERVEPPQCLYHGTARELARAILDGGLKPYGRQYVHLSSSVEEALSVGRRRDSLPAVLVINSQAAHADGIHFYQAGPLFLAKEIPPRFLSLWME
jgi:putative RNA 2'-phosphotransferase